MNQGKSRVAATLLALGVLFTLASAGSAGSAASGTRLWLARYNGPESGSDTGCCIAVSSDGRKVFVTGTSNGGTRFDAQYATLAYNAATGATLWVKRYNGGALQGFNTARSLAVSHGKVFVTGTNRDDDYATIAYDAATGATLWLKRYNGPASSDDQPYSVAASIDGTKVFVTGGSSGTTTRYDYATIAYDATTGAKLWGARYNGPESGSDLAYSVAVSDDGTKVFVTGKSWGGNTYYSDTHYDYATVAYDAATGAALWSTRYNGSGSDDDVATSVAVSGDGTKVFVTGNSTSDVSNLDYATVAYDAATGAELWSIRYNGPAGYYSSSPPPDSLAVSDDGTKVFIAGTSGANNADYVTIAYDAATGAPLWLKLYNGPGNSLDYALSVALTPDGTRVFVTGSSVGSTTGYDYATIAYDAATGAKLWSIRYNGPGSRADGASSLAVSPDGMKVFVTGSSYGGPTTGVDYATLAYQA